jgi:DnaJ-class molecular chaperone
LIDELVWFEVGLIDIYFLFGIVAYEVLSDDEKRKKYDQFGHDAFSQGGGGGGFGGGSPFGFNFDDIFKNFDFQDFGGDSFHFSFGGNDHGHGHHHQHQNRQQQKQQRGGGGGGFFTFDDFLTDVRQD